VGAEAVRDQQAFLDATLPHLDAVWGIARRSCHGHAEAEDLVQETFLRAFVAFDGHRGGDVRAWLAAICLNTQRSLARRARRRPEAERSLLAAERTDDVADRVLASLDRDAVAGALAQLPEGQRIALVLVDIAGLTAQQAADALGVPRGTILARVHRGRRQLTLLLEGVVDHGL
jgi:RNA polymerase sigma-70 factor, ECF subfamily